MSQQDSTESEGHESSNNTPSTLVDTLGLSAVQHRWDHSHFLRLQALREKGKEIVPTLIELCSHKNIDVRLDAILVLGWIGDPDAIPTLLDLLRNRDSHIMQRAGTALRNIGKPAAAGLIEALHDSDTAVQAYAASALGYIRAIEAVPDLSVLLERGQADSLICAGGWALGRMGDKQVIPLLVAALDYEGYRAHQILLRSIYDLSAPESVLTIMPLLNHESSSVRKRSIWLLGNGPVRLVFDVLREKLQDQDGWIRAAAINAVGRLGDPRIIPDLEKLLNDTHPFNSDHARIAIELLQSRSQ